MAYAGLLGRAIVLWGHRRMWGWQHQALAMIVDRRGDGAPVHAQATVVVCRQNGKTTLLGLVALDTLTRGETALFTLHERKMGLDKFLEWGEPLSRAMPDRYRLSRRAGMERITDTVTGGRVMLVTPDDAGGRSATADRIIVDEAAHIRPAFLRAAGATTLTRPMSQIVMISSGMTDDSVDLAVARDAAYADLVRPRGERRAGVCEWSAKTDPGHAGLDLDDEDLWARCIPTLGLAGGASLDAVRRERLRLPDEDFAREMLSVPSGSPLSPPVTATLWRGCQIEDLPPVAELRQIVLAVDTSPTQSWTSVVLAATADDRRVAGLVAHGSGDDWLLDTLVDLARRVRPVAVVVDSMSPAAHVIDRAARAGVPVDATTARDLTRSAAGLLSALTARRVGIAADDRLTAAATGAVRRHVADAGWAWHRRPDSGLDITPVVALSLAVWTADLHAP